RSFFTPLQVMASFPRTAPRSCAHHMPDATQPQPQSPLLSANLSNPAAVCEMAPLNFPGPRGGPDFPRTAGSTGYRCSAALGQRSRDPDEGRFPDRAYPGAGPFAFSTSQTSPRFRPSPVHPGNFPYRRRLADSLGLSNVSSDELCSQTDCLDAVRAVI